MNRSPFNNCHNLLLPNHHPNSVMAQMCTISEAARILGITYSGVYQRIQAGKLKTYRWYNRPLIKRSDLEGKE